MKSLFARNKKGYQFTQLPMLAVLFGIAIVATVVMADVIESMRSGFVTGRAGCNRTVKSGCGYDYNISSYGLEGQKELGSWYDMIGMIIAASVIITTLFFVFKGAQN
jgi:hypothetical protein